MKNPHAIIEYNWIAPYASPICDPVSAPIVQETWFTQVQNGTIEVSPGISYNGEMVKGIPEGQGEMYYTIRKEMIYKGSFKAGRYDGQGTLYRNNKIYKDGIFINGVMKSGTTIYPEGHSYKGDYEGGKRNGHGTLLFPCGVKMEGEWRDDSPVGIFTISLVKSPTGQPKTPGLQFNINTTYDFNHPDENTKLSVRLLENRLFYDDHYLMTGARPCFLFYLNGDVFIGLTNGFLDPTQGYYLVLTDNGYEVTMVGNKMEKMGVKDVDWAPEDLSKNISFVLTDGSD